MRAFLRPIAVAVLAAGLAACGSHAKPAAQTEAMPSPEQMEAAFKKASTPTEQHEFLKQFAGTYKVTSKMWMAPDAAPEVSTGKAVKTPVFGGRFLREDFTGSFMDKPFTGLGFTGYDTVAEQFSSVWLDSMGTSVMVSNGFYDPAAKTLTLKGEMSCPLTKDGKRSMRMALKQVDDKRHVFEMYSPGPDGKEFRTMEIDYVKTK